MAMDYVSGQLKKGGGDGEKSKGMDIPLGEGQLKRGWRGRKSKGMDIPLGEWTTEKGQEMGKEVRVWTFY